MKRKCAEEQRHNSSAYCQDKSFKDLCASLVTKFIESLVAQCRSDTVPALGAYNFELRLGEEKKVGEVTQ